MTLSPLRWPGTPLRVAAGATLVACVGAYVVVRVLYQQVMGLEPCWLCVAQRLPLGLLAMLSAVALFVPGAHGLRWGVVAVATVGLALAGWHVYLLHFAPPTASCSGAEWGFLVETQGFVQALMARLGGGDGSCTDDPWLLFGFLSIPLQSALLYAGLGALWLGVREGAAARVRDGAEAAG